MGSESDYRQCFSRADLEIVSVEDLSRRVKRTWILCLARALRAVLVNAQARRFVLDRRQANRVFALTVARLWLAYQVGAMRYVVFTTDKP
jgi:tocopherol O-methyltransferase